MSLCTKLTASAMMVAAPSCAHAQQSVPGFATAAADSCPGLALQLVQLGGDAMAAASKVTDAVRLGTKVSPETMAAVGTWIFATLAGNDAAEGETRLMRLIQLQRRYQSACQTPSI